MSRPPAGWRRLLHWVLPPDDRDLLVDELDRMYLRRASSDGEQAASRWYRSEVLHLARHGPAERLRGALARTFAEIAEGLRHLRFAARGLRRSPGFTVVAVLTLGLGIGATAVIVGIADRAILRPLPYPEPDRLVAVLDGWSTSLGSIEILQREMRTVELIGGAQNAAGMTLEPEDGPAERVSVAALSPEYLRALRVTPALGRVFAPEEATPGRSSVVLLGDPFWRSHFGGDADVLGRSLLLDGELYEIVGVLPPGFDLPAAHNDLWRPASMDASNPGVLWGAGNHTVVARMAAGASPEAVRQEVLRAQDLVREANPLWTPNPGFWNEARVTPLGESRGQGVRTPLLILMGAVSVLLLVVCANVASLFLSRGLARARDHAVRAALGSPARRLAAAQMVEVLVVGGLGLVAGLLLALGGLALLRPHLPPELPGAALASLDVRIVLITAVVSLLTAVAAGVVPAARAARRDPATFLRESARGGGMAPTRRRATRLLVAAQIAAAVVLVTSAGLLARTLTELGRVDPGFETRARVTARVHLPPGLSTDREARAVYFEDLAARLEAAPDLRRVALASTIPFGGEDEYVATVIDGVTTDPNDLPVLPHHRVSPGFFEVAGIPLLEGRPFDAGDRPGTPLVAIADETFVDRFLGGRSAVGQVVRYPWRGAPPIQVVGVVGAVFHDDLAGEPEPTLWVPLAQMGMGALGHATVLASTSGTVDAGLAAISRRARDMDDRIAVSDLAPYPALLSGSLAGTRLLTMLLAIFAGTTLALGCVGVYGVAAFSVRGRIREIGVRLAMGAPASGIRWGVLRDGARLVLPGGIVGLLLAVPVARALEGVLYGVTPVDPLTFGLAPVLLTVAALLAIYVPARRATRVDPATVLREE